MKLAGQKAHDFAASPGKGIWSALVACDDEGLSAELGETLFRSWAAYQPAERVTLTEEDLARDKGLLFERLEARSLLGDRPIIMIELASERQSKYVVEAIEAGDESPDRFEARLILMAGALKKTSKLRKTLESARNAAMLQIYPDNEADMARIAGAALKAESVEIEDAALTRFLSGIPANRRLVRAELEKLCLYARGLNRPINSNDIAALSADHAEAAISDLVDTALCGDAGPMLRHLERLESTGTSPITLLRALQREAIRLLDASQKDIGSAASAKQLRPPVWPDQWPTFRRKLQAWNEARLVRLIGRIEACEAQVKSAGAIGDAATRLFLNDIARAAAAAAR